MSITHEDARRLIHFKSDEALKEIDRSLLEAHLRSCQECQMYAARIAELESALRPLLQKKWSQHPLPLSTGKAASERTTRLAQNAFFAIRIAAMCIICITFLFNIWQSTRSAGQSSIPPSADIPLIPTPSRQSTQTQLNDQACEPVAYVVQKNDTLDSIAKKYFISVEEIKDANNLRTDHLNTSTYLSIPVCNTTPSGTPNTIKTAFTPLIGSTTLTPVNGPTQ